MSPNLTLKCVECGHRFEGAPLVEACPNCGSTWLEAFVDPQGRREKLLERARSRPFDMWRYLEALPVAEGRPSHSMGEGGTPLIRAENLGMMLGLDNLFIKDERQGPTGSFKDRQAALTLAVLKEAGRTEAVVASTGNVGISFSAYGARSGVKIWAFLTSLVPPSKMHEIALYGTQVVKVTSTYDQAKELAAEFASRRGLYVDRGTRSIAAVESMKTIGYEIAEQLGALGRRETSTSGDGSIGWQAPDWYFQAVSGGIGPVGVQKSFTELNRMGLIDQLPALGIVQAAGCAPMVQAWKADRDTAEPVASPSTHISTLSTGDPGRTYSILRRRMQDGGGGTMESVTDEEAFRAMHLLAKMEGLSVEPAAAVAFAGLIKLAQQGMFDRDQTIVVNCSGHTIPIERELLGEGWSEEIDLVGGQLPESPREGLLAALARLDQRSTREVLIVDDHADARRLVRRVLQAQGDFTIREVQSGPEAIQSVRERRPDLIILDLMMPEMDGFEVLEKLRERDETARVPVIVVTAKNLTREEKQRLEGRISRLMMKGDFLTEDLIAEISKVLE